MFVLFWSAKKITRTPSPKVQGRSNKKTRPKLKTKTQRQNETKQKPLQGEIALDLDLVSKYEGIIFRKETTQMSFRF